MTVVELARRLRERELSPAEAVSRVLERIRALDGQLNTFISVRADEALREAEAAARASERGPLWGVPLAVKDVIDIAGSVTTAGSRILSDNIAETDAEAVARLRRAGAIVVGKTNTHEFAYGPTTTSAHFGRACNPWAPDRVCGGSSGGSGGAVAADLVPAALGTDTAGSIRIPSAFCGVTGLRPSTGLVSTQGMVPLSWSVDTVGPMARTAEDCALLLEVLVGEGMTLETPDEPSVGVVDALFEGAIEPGVARAAREGVEALRDAGVRTTSIDLPHLDRAPVVQQALQFPEATSIHLEWLRTRLGDYGGDVRGRLLAGLFVPATAYVTAVRARSVIAAAFRSAAEPFDCLVAPTLPSVAPLFGRSDPLAENLFRQGLLRYTAPWSLVGWPVVSVPCGFADGMPVGLSIIARRFRDADALAIAARFQRTTDWHLQRAPTADAVGGRSG
jgi:aspartyl-tRNA(Asn)/glutamyl-tRNA(Gln) amidotransferase subunit A